MPYPLSQSVIPFPASDIHTLVKSCSIKFRNDPKSPKSEVEHEIKVQFKDFLFNTLWVAEWIEHLPCSPQMVGVMSSIPTGGNFIFC